MLEAYVSLASGVHFAQWADKIVGSSRARRVRWLVVPAPLTMEEAGFSAALLLTVSPALVNLKRLDTQFLPDAYRAIVLDAIGRMPAALEVMRFVGRLHHGARITPVRSPEPLLDALSAHAATLRALDLIDFHVPDDATLDEWPSMPALVELRVRCSGQSQGMFFARCAIKAAPRLRILVIGQTGTMPDSAGNTISRAVYSARRTLRCLVLTSEPPCALLITSMLAATQLRLIAAPTPSFIQSSELARLPSLRHIGLAGTDVATAEAALEISDLVAGLSLRTLSVSRYGHAPEGPHFTTLMVR